MPLQLLLDVKKPLFHVSQKVRCKIACRTGGSLFSVSDFDLHEINFEKHLPVTEVCGIGFQNRGTVLHRVGPS